MKNAHDPSHVTDSAEDGSVWCANCQRFIENAPPGYQSDQADPHPPIDPGWIIPICLEFAREIHCGPAGSAAIVDYVNERNGVPGAWRVVKESPCPEDATRTHYTLEC